MDTLKINIDGVLYDALPNETIMSLADRVGIGDRIPRLCFDPALPPYTSCYVCVVEQEGVGKLLPACSTAVAPNMVLHTQSQRVESARKTALELLMSNHPADCVAPCSRGCPAGVDVQRYLAQARNGEYLDAVRTIRERNPLPVVCGRVCVRKCEDVCRRKYLDDAVGINMVKRTASDWWIDHPYDESTPTSTGKRIAIVGGGPAGLTAAYFLRMKGHEVTIYEAQQKLGGMLRWGIPDYRLPQDILDFEINEIIRLGVEVHTGVWVGKDIPFEEIRSKYDAVYLSLGAQLGSEAHIKGEEHPGVMTGVEFLDSVKKGHDLNIAGRRVVVVGGGNTAIDASRTALRLGAEHVTILYRRTRKEMPANPEEIVAAEEEGVRIEFLIAPLEVQAVGETLTGLICEKMQLGEPDASGRRRPVPVPNSNHMVTCDIVIGAIGQKVDLSGLTGESNPLTVTRWNTVKADELSSVTSIPGVFSGGDCVTGPAVVIDAIGAGRKAALSIDQYVTVGQPHAVVEPFSARRENFGEIRKAELPPAAAYKRHHLPSIDVNERLSTFEEVELSLEDHETVEEAGRCLSCGCSAAPSCELRALCERYGLSSTVSGQTVFQPVDRAHPFITIDPNKCILCTKCVRTCGDILGVSALGLVNRGFDTVISPALGKTLMETSCVSCGNCVDACPTGALSFKGLARTDPAQKSVTSLCTLCGAMCSMEVATNQFGVSFRTAKGADGKRTHLCGLGRFGYEVLQSGERLKTPMIRRHGALVQCSWDEALKAAAEGMQRVREQNGGKSILVSGGAYLSCEEASVVAQLGRTALGARVGSLAAVADDGDVYSLDEVYGATGSTVSYDDLEAASLILVVGDDPMERNPVTAARIRRAVRNGAKVISIMPKASSLRWLASVRVENHPGAESLVLGWLVRKIIERRPGDVGRELAVVRDALSDCTENRLAQEAGVAEGHLEAAFDALMKAQGSVVAMYAIDSPHGRSPDSTILLAQLLELLRPADQRSGLLLTQNAANLMGLKTAGMLPEDKEEYVAFAEAIRRGSIRAAWLVRESPSANPMLSQALARLDFLVVQSTVMTEIASRADVVLPATTHLETGGTFVRCDGTIMRVDPALPNPAAMTTTDAIEKVLQLLQVDMEAGHAAMAQRLAKCDLRLAVKGQFRWLLPRPGVDRSSRTDSEAAAHPYIRSKIPVRV